MRTSYLQWFLTAFEQLFGQFEWSEAVLTSGVRAQALQYVADYNLETHDAVHLASAFRHGVIDLASLDEAFRRVDGLNLWNDLIHVQPATTGQEPVH